MTDKGVAALKPRAKRYVVADPQMSGHWVRVQPTGVKSFWAVTRNPNAKQIWTHVGPASMGIKASRESARTVLQRVRDGLPAFEPPAESFGDVAANWLKRHVDAKGVVNAPKIRYLLKKHVLPRWKDREATSIRKSDIAALLDHHFEGSIFTVSELVKAAKSKNQNMFDDSAADTAAALREAIAPFDRNGEVNAKGVGNIFRSHKERIINCDGSGSKLSLRIRPVGKRRGSVTWRVERPPMTR